VPEIKDAVAQGLARFVSIPNEAGTLMPARFEEFERSTLVECLDLGRCVVRGVLEDQMRSFPTRSNRTVVFSAGLRRAQRRSRRSWEQ